VIGPTAAAGVGAHEAIVLVVALRWGLGRVDRQQVVVGTEAVSVRVSASRRRTSCAGPTLSCHSETASDVLERTVKDNVPGLIVG